MGVLPSFEDEKISINASINDIENDIFTESVSEERRPKKNLGTKRKMNFQEEALELEKNKIKIMEERLRKNFQANTDEDYMLLMSLLQSTKKLDDIQRLELRMDFLSSVTRKLQISKNLLSPVNSVPTASHISCPPTLSPQAASLDSTHSRDSDTLSHPSQMSFM